MPWGPNFNEPRSGESCRGSPSGKELGLGWSQKTFGRVRGQDFFPMVDGMFLIFCHGKSRSNIKMIQTESIAICIYTPSGLSPLYFRNKDQSEEGEPAACNTPFEVRDLRRAPWTSRHVPMNMHESKLTWPFDLEAMQIKTGKKHQEIYFPYIHRSVWKLVMIAGS